MKLSNIPIDNAIDRVCLAGMVILFLYACKSFVTGDFETGVLNLGFFLIFIMVYALNGMIKHCREDK